MSHRSRHRATEQRRALGRRVRAYRYALDLTTKDIAAHVGTGKAQLWAVENANDSADVLLGTFIDIAAAVGLEVGLVASYHLPLLDLTADELAEVIVAARMWQTTFGGPDLLRSALDKLTTTKENPE